MPARELEPCDLSDDELLARLKRLARCEREVTALLVAHLAELDARQLHVVQGYSSLFTYCTQVLQLSEHAAYGRIEAARAARRFPAILDMLANGSLNLTGVTLLGPHLTRENYRMLLERAEGKSRRQIEELIASVRPLPPVPTVIRKLPSGGKSAPALSGPVQATIDTATDDGKAPAWCDPAADTASNPLEITPSSGQSPGHAAGGNDPHAPAPLAASRRSALHPLSPEHYNLQLTLRSETHLRLRQAQELLRHRIPGGDLAEILDVALKVLVDRLQRQKFGATGRQGRRKHAARPGKRIGRSRYISAEVRREVWDRDGAQCTHVSPEGVRCSERGRLEFDHEIPFALGGQSTVENVRLRCRRHNLHSAEMAFGRGWNRQK